MPWSSTSAALYIKEDFANYNQSMYNFLSLRADEVDELTVGSGRHRHRRTFGANSLVFYDNNVRASEPTTKGVDLQAAWYGDGWSLSGQVGQSKADNDLKQWFIEPAFTGGFSWDIKRGITFDDPAAARDPANWVAEGFFGNHGIFETEAEDTYGAGRFQPGVRRHVQRAGRRRAPPQARGGFHAQRLSASLRVGDLAQVGTIGLTDIQGFAPDHGRHVYAGRGNVINWVNAAPAELRQSGCGELPQQHLQHRADQQLGLCAAELRQGAAPARQFRRSLREGRDRKHGVRPGKRRAGAAGATRNGW